MTGRYMSLIYIYLWLGYSMLDIGMDNALKGVIFRFPSFGPEAKLMCLGVFFADPSRDARNLPSNDA